MSTKSVKKKLQIQNAKIICKARLKDGTELRVFEVMEDLFLLTSEFGHEIAGYDFYDPENGLDSHFMMNVSKEIANSFFKEDNLTQEFLIKCTQAIIKKHEKEIVIRGVVDILARQIFEEPVSLSNIVQDMYKFVSSAFGKSHYYNDGNQIEISLDIKNPSDETQNAFFSGDIFVNIQDKSLELSFTTD